MTERALLALLIVAGLLSLIHAPFPSQMLLQHIPTVAAVAILSIAAKRRTLSTIGFACVIAFLLFHVLGARYIYSYVPYDDWAQRLFGVNITERFHFRRNHYDRVVHFAFGALAVRPVWDLLTRKFGVPRRFASSLIYKLSSGD